MWITPWKSWPRTCGRWLSESSATPRRLSFLPNSTNFPYKWLAPKGTLGVLRDAYKAGTVGREDLEFLTLDLIQKGYRIKEDVLVDFLRALKL